jgi:DNA-directed RNA polymerase specialized sigma24 family protein
MSSPEFAVQALYGSHHGWLNRWLRARLGNAAEGLTHKQIAKQMGLSLRSVERYVADGFYHYYLLRYQT